MGGNGGAVTRCYSSGTVSGDDDVGALVGDNGGRAAVTQCYSTGAVSGRAGVGGLVGLNQGDVTHCYSTGAVSGRYYVGGLVGYNWQGNIAASFWDIETSGQTTGDGGTGLTTAQMKRASTFHNARWDFVGETKNGTEDIWCICETQDYPNFAWQFIPGDLNADYNVDLHDLAVLSIRWWSADSGFFWCRGADLTNDGFVNWQDLMVFAENWLGHIPP